MLQTGSLFNGDPFVTLRVPSVNRVGTGFDVAFSAIVGGSANLVGVFVDRDVTSPSSLAPTAVFLEDDSLVIQGLAGGNPVMVNNINQGLPPALGAGGHVAQTTTVDGGGISPNTLVLLLRGPSVVDPLQAVCFQGQAISGGGTDTYNLVTVPFALTQAGEIGFHATVTGGTAMVFADSSQNLQLVARTDDPADGTNDDFNVIAGITSSEFAPRFASTGRSAFRATTNGMSVSGIWIDDPVAGVSWIADQTSLAPPSTTQKFLGFKAPSTSSSGALAFRGCLNTSCSNDGIWRFNGSTLVLVAQDQNTAPDPGGNDPGNGDVYSGFSDPVVNVAGDVCFRAEVQSGSAQGIWRWHGNGIAGLRRVVRSGDALRGTSDTFSTFGPQIALAESGQIAFTAMIADDNQVLSQGLFVTSELGSVVKIAKVGDSISIGGVDKFISSIDFYAGSTSQGNGGFIRNVGIVPGVTAIAYTLSFVGGGQAVMLTTLE